MESTTVFFTALMAGYRLNTHRKPKTAINHADAVMRVDWEITGSGSKNQNVMKYPAEIPAAPPARMTINAWEKMIFIMFFGLAPKALIIPNSCCCPETDSIR